MRDVVIVGGGLTGLSAAYELEKQHIPYTLIEVKRRTGGSIQTVRQDDFVMDGAAFAVDKSIRTEPLIDELALRDELAEMPDVSGAVMFRRGTEALIQALMAKLTAPRLMRMAVSSIGELDNGRYALCLENGLMLDAGSIILAVPARYTERMFYGYINDISARLRDFRYLSIARISLGLSSPLPVETGNAVTFVHTSIQSERVPPGKTLLQIGTHNDVAHVDSFLQTLNLPEPVTRYVHHWPEADLIYAENHTDMVAAMRAMLPPGVALVGSDYGDAPKKPGVANLADRIAQGRQAAQKMTEFLRNP